MVIPALLIAVFLTFVARPVAVALVLTPFKGKISQQLLVSWAGLRGAASIVFAIMAEMAVETENDVFHIVFYDRAVFYPASGLVTAACGKEA